MITIKPKRYHREYKILDSYEIIRMLKEHIEKYESVTPQSLEEKNKLLFNNIFNKNNYEGLPQKGIRRLYFYLDQIYGDDYDYKFLLNKLHADYWTDKRIIKVIKGYIEFNKSMEGFYKQYPALAQVIRKKHKPLGIEYYLNLIGYNYSEVFSYHRNGDWTKEYTYEVAKDVWIRYGILSRRAWISAGYPETPLNKYGIQEICKAIGYESELKGKDGNYYKSGRELLVANILFFLNIKYEKDRAIECQENIPVNKRLKYDFLIMNTQGNVYVEVWGYSEKKQRLH